MTNKGPTGFFSFPVSVSLPKFEPVKDKQNMLLKRYYFMEPHETQSNVFGSEDDFSLTCWRDSATAEFCRYVFGVKLITSNESSTSGKHYRFVEPQSNGAFLQWSQAKVLTSNGFSDTDNRLFRYNKCSLIMGKCLQHVQSGKYVSINDDHQIVLKEGTEYVEDITITDQPFKK